jgi:hypothetical protein
VTVARLSEVVRTISCAAGWSGCGTTEGKPVTDPGYQPVTVSRRVSAPAHVIFQLLADPARHTEFDGSGMLRGAVPGSKVTGAGDVFTMKMYYQPIGDYQMDNHVVEFERDRRIGWEPVAGHGHPDAGQATARWGHRWGFKLTPDGPDATIVTQFFDCSQVPEPERAEIDGGRIWEQSMAATLERLDALATARPRS